MGSKLFCSSSGCIKKMVNLEELSNIGPPDTFLVTQDEKKISCHKSILIQESHYFKAMFSPNFAEKDQKEIKLQVRFMKSS